MIPQTFIQDLLNRIDIVNIISQHISLKKNSTNYIGFCPFHKENSPSFTVSQKKQFYYCFGCGTHGTVITFLTKHVGLNFIDAVKNLAHILGVTLPAFDNQISLIKNVKQQSKNMAMLEIIATVSIFYKRQLRDSQHAINYLKKRGLTGKIASKFILGFAPNEWNLLYKLFINSEMLLLVDSGLIIEKNKEKNNQYFTHKYYDRFRNRIIFPIRNVQGKIIGFGGRAIDNSIPKYLNSPETSLFQKGKELYGLFEAREAIRAAGYVLVTEGYMDVLILVKSGFSHTVATLGTACTAIHIQKLLHHTNEIIFSFDGDAAGKQAARRALNICLMYASDKNIIKFLFLPFEHDPDSYIREFGAINFEQRVQEAVPLSQFLISEAISTNDITTLEGRARIQFNAKKMIEILSPSYLRLQILHNLAKITQSTPQEIESLLKLEKSISHSKKKPLKNKQIAPIKLESQIIRLLITYPALIADLDQTALHIIERLAPDQAYMITKIIETYREKNNQINSLQFFSKINTNYNSLISVKTKSEFEIIRQEMADAIQRSKIRLIENDMEQLILLGLKDEKTRNNYRKLMQEKEYLKKIQKNKNNI